MTPTITISKLDAARRQLETATVLYFHYGDPVSIHTLCAAAYNVIRDLNTKGGGEFMLKDLGCLLDSREAAEFTQRINEAENFFKHADRDPDAVCKLNHEWTEVLLLDAIQRYLHLTGEHSAVMRVFTAWYMIRHPRVFREHSEYANFYAQLDLCAIGDDRTRFVVEFLPVVIAASASRTKECWR